MVKSSFIAYTNANLFTYFLSTQYRDNMRITIARVARELIDSPSLSPRTKAIYEGAIIPFLQKYGSRKIDEITRREVIEYLESRTDLSIRTYKLHQRIIGRLFNFAIDNNYLDFSPVRRLPRKTLASHLSSDEGYKYLESKTLDILFDAASVDPQTYALLRLLYESGARIKEILTLSLHDINFREHQFQVIGKGNKRRYCYFGRGSKEALEQYIKHERPHPHKALFTERNKTSRVINYLSYSSAYRRMKDVTEDYPELSTFTFHQLRHTFATERANIMPIEVLRALMGHENIQTTLIYQKITSRVAKQAAQDALDALR